MAGRETADDGVGSSHCDREEIRVKIRGVKESKIHIRANLNATVVNFKSIVAKECGIPVKRLIHNGRVMKDNQTLRSYGLEDNQTVYVVRGSAPDAAIQDRELASMLEEMRQLIDDSILVRYMFYMPVVRDLFNDPPSVCNMLMRKEPLSDIMDHNPEVAHILNDPTTLRVILDASHNLEILHEMMRKAMDEASSVESAEAELTELSEELERAELRHETTINSPTTDTNPLQNSYASAPTARTHTNSGALANPIVNPMADSLGVLDFPGNTASNEYMEESMVEETIHRMFYIPQFLIKFFGFNPRLRNVLDSNPQIRDVMLNPEFIILLATPQIVNAILVGHNALFVQAVREEVKRRHGWTGEGEVTASDTLQRLIDMFGDLATRAGLLPGTASAPQAAVLGHPIVNTMPGVLDFPDLERLPASILDITDSSGSPEDPMVDETIHRLFCVPQFLIQFFGFTPRLRNVLDSNPRIRDVMLNPEFTRQLATRQIVNALLIYHNALNAQSIEDEIAGRDQVTAAQTLQRLIDLFGELATRAGMIPSSPRADRPEHGDRYITQLARLQEMGFTDTQENIQALIATAGNVQLAVERIRRNRG
ncbi:ubiquitin domain-containing protein DSK2a-like [Salvia divinorum]|uniref:Ubiquitin domain-containing protein DSK2a-like n=1 Tax=Salvia divinorum TaxID=28513 RepID=A0ABD1IRH8_SALDI